MSQREYDMDDNADTMVLRSFHLPQSMDDELRGLAFNLRCAKADVLRFFINVGLTSLGDWRSWDREALDQLAQAVHVGGASKVVHEGIARDIALLGGGVAEYASTLRAGPSQATS